MIRIRFEGSLRRPTQMQFIALFNFNGTQYAPGNETVVREALDAALANPNTSLKIVGHADRSGPVAYNQSLFERRANRVIEELVSGDVDLVRISGEAIGETLPLVPTADDEREEGSCAVVINLN